MEKSTGGLDLDLITDNSIDTDDIRDSLIKSSNNFVTIEKSIHTYIMNPDDYEIGTVIPRLFRLWNENPTIGDYLGWVNIREGENQKRWKANTAYAVGDRIKPVVDNNNVYECITEGRSMNKIPNFQVGNGVEFNDANGASWQPSYNYNVGDIVFQTNGDETFYYTCEIAGLTHYNEPNWSTIVPGSTLIDETTVWRKEKNIKWKQVADAAEFRPFGKIE